MVLFPANRSASSLVVPFVIPLSVAHQYVASDGHPNLLYALGAAVDAAVCLGMAPEMSTVHRIIDIIVEGVPDLVMMPPEPEQPRPASEPAGELSIRIDGDQVLNTEVAA